MSAWCLCVWRSGRGAKELADASLPELLASGGSVCGQPAVDWAAATVATPLLRTTDPRLCWVSFPSHKIVTQAAERCALLHAAIQVWATADSIQDAADVATSRVSEWDRVSGLPPLATWDIEGFAISVCRQSGAAEGKRQQRDTKRQVDAFRRAGVGTHPAAGSPTLAVVALWDGAAQVGAWMGPVLGWGCAVKRKWGHEFATPTSMGPTEAVLTAGLAGAAPGKLTLDPCCGGGALLAGAACLGADTLCGSDVDASGFQLRRWGHAASGMTPGGTGTQEPGLVITSAFHPAWRSGTFDIIVCDPPYGVRAAIVGGSPQEGDAAQAGAPAAPPRGDFQAEVLVKLLRAAAALLTPGGRLVSWMPLDGARPVRCPATEGARCGACTECRVRSAAAGTGLALCCLVREARASGLQRALAVFQMAGGGGGGGAGRHAEETRPMAFAPVCVADEGGGSAQLGPAPALSCQPPGRSPLALPGSLPSRLHASAAHHRRESYAASKSAASGSALDVWRAAWVGDTAAVEGYLAAGGAADQRDARGQTPLQHACGYGRLPVCRALLAAGADASAAEDPKAMTPLHRAATWGHHAIVQLLLDGGADPLLRDRGGRASVHLAAYHGHTAALRALLARTDGDGIDAEDGDGFTALHLSARWGEADSVAMLLEAGAQPMRPGGTQRHTAAHLAARWGHVQVLRVLLRHAPGLAGVGCSLGATPLAIAQEWGRHPCVEYLQQSLSLRNQ
eukprot:jgi/Tetstr1/464598/TSEL_009353.t1